MFSCALFLPLLTSRNELQFSFEIASLRQSREDEPHVISVVDSERERLDIIQSLHRMTTWWMSKTLAVAPLSFQSNLNVELATNPFVF